MTAEDESDGSSGDEEWAGFDELNESDGSEVGEDESLDHNDHEMEAKQGEPSDAQPKAAGQFSHAHCTCVEL
jgi:hypothetical protein